MVATATPYGFCPQCGAAGATRERRPNGYDTCVDGHKYLSTQAVQTKVAPMEMRGPLAIYVTDHARAEGLAELLGAMRSQDDQGAVVIPFAASALAYCGSGTRLFRGLVIIPPRPGQGVDRAAFDQWVERAIAPYAVPAAPRVVL